MKKFLLEEPWQSIKFGTGTSQPNAFTRVLLRCARNDGACDFKPHPLLLTF